MENDENMKIKEVQVLECQGRIPDERGLFAIERIDDHELLIHGGCNFKKEYDQIHILDISNFHYRNKKTAFGNLF